MVGAVGEVLLRINDLSLVYPGNRVLQDITFAVERGEFLGVIGPNGSGKTTLLKALSGLLRPAAGEVLLSDRDLRRWRAAELARRIAVVGQSAKVDFDFTVEEVVLMGRLPHLGRWQRESAADLARVRWAMEATGILDLARRPITQVSGGEAQRALVARSLAQETDILLLDEPTSHLDLGYQVEILDLLRRLNEGTGLTVIAVLHDLNLAALYCQRLLLLHRGGIYAAGTPQEILNGENLQTVYGSPVAVSRHPLYGVPQITLLPGALVSGARSSMRVHVVGGGGTAGPIYADLVARGFLVTTGVLNQGDSDWEAARSLGLEMVEAPAFSPVPPEASERNLRLMLEADIVLVTDLPFGPGNLGNLRNAAEAQIRGRLVCLLEGDPEVVRDFTGGEARRILDGMVGQGAAVISDRSRIHEYIGEMQRG